MQLQFKSQHIIRSVSPLTTQAQYLTPDTGPMTELTSTLPENWVTIHKYPSLEALCSHIKDYLNYAILTKRSLFYWPNNRVDLPIPCPEIRPSSTKLWALCPVHPSLVALWSHIKDYLIYVILTKRGPFY